MAIYHLRATIISRSAGRSATAAAAYRTAERIEDQRTGLIFDYRARGGVDHVETLAPANAPDWVQDRAALWNAVEQAETRKNSQVAREVRVALPHELDAAQRVELVRDSASASSWTGAWSRISLCTPLAARATIATTMPISC